ncbi:hypothetical protein CRYUN_Cryun38cG0008200 [Craigia yunnanensis]
MKESARRCEEMLRMGLVPRKEGNIQQVFKLYYEMEYRSLSPGLPVFTTFIGSLCHCGKLGEAEKYLRIMKDRSMSLSEDIYEALITGHLRKGDKIRAGLLHNEMVAERNEAPQGN